LSNEDPHRPTRRRRSGEEARREILEAAQRRLTEGGPDAVRLKDVAAEVGISHPAVLHHFGSREGLLRALELHAMGALERDLLSGAGSAHEMLEHVFAVLGDQGHAQLLAWLSQRGRLLAGDGEVRMLRTLAEAIAAEVSAAHEAAGEAPADPVEAAFVVRLAAAALFGEAIIGPLLSQSAGFEDDDETRARFHHWLAMLLESRL